jgi:hypothetical protein
MPLVLSTNSATSRGGFLAFDGLPWRSLGPRSVSNSKGADLATVERAMPSGVGWSRRMRLLRLRQLGNGLAGDADAKILWWLNAAINFIFWQVLTWLRHAYWPSQSAAEQFIYWGVPIPSFSHWLGLQKIIDSVLAWPSTVVDVLLGFACAGVMQWALNKHEEVCRLERNASTSRIPEAFGQELDDPY